MQFHRLGFWYKIMKAKFLVERIAILCGGEFDIVEIEFVGILDQELHKFFCVSLLSKGRIGVDIEDKTCAAIDKRRPRGFFRNKKQCNGTDLAAFICSEIGLNIFIQMFLEILVQFRYKIIDIMWCKTLMVFVQVSNSFFYDLWDIGNDCLLVPHFNSSFLPFLFSF